MAYVIPRVRAMIQSFNTTVGVGVNINSLDDFDTHKDNFKRFFEGLPADQRIDAFNQLVTAGRIKGNTFGRFDRYLHSHDDLIKRFDKLRKDSRLQTIEEFKTIKSRTHSGIFDYRDPQVWGISPEVRLKLYKLLSKLYNTIHLKYFIPLFRVLPEAQQQELNLVPRYSALKIEARKIEQEVIFASEPDNGHIQAMLLDTLLGDKIRIYTAVELARTEDDINDEIQQIIDEIMYINPLIPEEDVDDDYVITKEEILQEQFLKSIKCKEEHRAATTESKIDRSKFDVLDLEKKYLKYKAKYLALKEKLGL